MEKKLFLLDAYALIFRAYYAFISNPMTNSQGIPTSTVFGFTLALDELLRKENPSHIAVVFDPPGPTFRHEMYSLYKANRDATPEDLKSAVPYIKRLLEGYNIPIVEVAGFEADDTIGTLSKIAEKDGFTVFMMTPDKDFAQLVSENIFMYKPGRGGAPAEVLGVEEVKKKFLVERPEQVIDILALWGDASDNIPGAPGVGEKTAKKLVAQFSSVEGVYENIDQLKGKQKENLENSIEQVKLSKVLATIALDVPVDISPLEMDRRAMNKEALTDLFKELEFRNLAKRIFSTELNSGQESAASGKGSQVLASARKATIPVGEPGTLFGPPAEQQGEVVEQQFQNIETVDHLYQLVNDAEGVRRLADTLSGLKSFCFDTETTGIDPIDARLVGIAFSWEAHKGYYVAMGEDMEELNTLLKILEEPFSNPDIEKCGQNLKYDLHILKTYQIEVKGHLFDTMVAHFLLRPEQRHNLSIMAEQYLDYSMVSIEELIGKKGVHQASFRSVELEKAKEYASEDADITWQLAEIFKKKLKEEGIQELSHNIEMPLVRVLMEMEHQGVKLDVSALRVFAEELRGEIIVTQGEIHELAGVEFNIGSPKQLGEILFDRMKIVEAPKKTKTKQYATGEEVLVQLSDKHPIVDKVLEYRSLKKLLSTYVDALPQLVKPKNDKIHTSYNQTVVTTGRLSSNNPNLQNIPIREERGREIRRAFIPEKAENLFLSADYSQIELRLMAHLSEDPVMIEAFVNDADIHTATAAKIYKIEEEEVSREMRSKAKTANFGIIYGISAFGLSQRMRIPRGEAKELIEGYFETYPGVKAYMDRCITMAREDGYVETMYGRRRFLPDILSRNSTVRGNAERNAINSPIQGSAADIIKIAMVRIQEAMKNEHMESFMILQVHDELNFDVIPEEIEQLRGIVKEQMENVAQLKVPLTIDMGEGVNWLEAH
jgi:DNA polymerase I